MGSRSQHAVLGLPVLVVPAAVPLPAWGKRASISSGPRAQAPFPPASLRRRVTNVGGVGHPLPGDRTAAVSPPRRPGSLSPAVLLGPSLSARSWRVREVDRPTSARPATRKMLGQAGHGRTSAGYLCWNVNNDNAINALDARPVPQLTAGLIREVAAQSHGARPGRPVPPYRPRAEGIDPGLGRGRGQPVR